MKVKVPKKIRLCTYNYEIRLIERMASEHKLLGLCLTDDGLIKIDSGSIPQIKDMALIHELTHAINDIFTLGLDEKTIDLLSQGWAMVLKNNLGIEFDWNMGEK